MCPAQRRQMGKISGCRMVPLLSQVIDSRWNITDGLEQTLLVEPRYPFQGGQEIAGYWLHALLFSEADLRSIAEALEKLGASQIRIIDDRKIGGRPSSLQRAVVWICCRRLRSLIRSGGSRRWPSILRTTPTPPVRSSPEPRSLAVHRLMAQAAMFLQESLWSTLGGHKPAEQGHRSQMRTERIMPNQAA